MMPDIPPPPPGFTLDQPGALPPVRRPVIRKGVEPQNRTVQDNYVIDPNSATATPIAGLPPKSEKPDRTNLPKGWEIGPDGTARPIAGLPPDLVEGGPEERDLQTALGDINNVIEAAKRAKERSKGWFMTGFLSSLGGMTPEGKSLKGDLDIIGSNVAFDRLAKMRQESPTGGALGAITEKELELLKNSSAAIAPDQTDVDFQRNMDSVIERYSGIAQRLSGGASSDQKKEPDIAAPSLGGGSVPGDTQPPPPIDASPVTGGVDDGGPSLTPSGGETRSVIDPKKQALGQKIVGLATKGADFNTIMGFAVRADPSLRDDAKFRGWVQEAVKYRKQHPGAKFSIDPGFYTSEVPLSGFEKEMTRVGSETAGGAAAVNAADAITAGNLGKIVGDEEATDRALAMANQRRPGASLAGTVAGGVSAAMTGEAALARLGMAPGLLRGMTADVGYGATAGGTNAPEGEGLEGAGKGALLAAGGSLGGNYLGRMGGNALKGVTNPTVSYAAKEVPGSLTIGQAVSQSGRLGQAIKGVEDRLSGIPVVGDAVNARRLEGLQKMNSRAFDKALEPIGGNAGGKFGEDAVAAAQDQVGQAFTRALSGKSASLDRPFIAAAEKAKMGVDKLPDRVRDEVNNSIDEVVNNYFDDGGNISGENMQALLRELGAIKRGYQSDPLGHRIGNVVDAFTDSVEGLFRRQAPDVMPQYEAAKKAFRRLSTLEDAVLRGKNTGGVFTTGQLGLADRANTSKFGGKHAAAAGKGEFHDFQRNMQEVLPNKVPDSGTAGRIIVPAALLSAGAGADSQGAGGTGLTLAALLSLAYSRTGQSGLRASVLSRGNALRGAGERVRKAAPKLGHAGTSVAVREATRD